MASRRTRNNGKLLLDHETDKGANNDEDGHNDTMPIVANGSGLTMNDSA